MNARFGTRFSRRALMRGGAGLVASAGARLAVSQSNGPSGQPRPPAVRATVVRQFKGAQLLAISPDGGRMCLYAFRRAEMFLRRWSYDGGNTSAAGDVLSVVDVRTGGRTYATQLRTFVSSASFFADGKRLYAETIPMAESEGGKLNVVQRVTIDLSTRRLEETLSRIVGTVAEYYALSWPSMLGVKATVRTPTPSSLVRVEMPGFNETAEVPFEAHPKVELRGPGVLTGGGHVVYGRYTMPVVSAGRQTVVYGAGNYVVCRRTSDLGLLWDYLVEPEYSGAVAFAVTPDGSRVAAAIVGGSSVGDKNKFYVGVLDGQKGSVIARLAVNVHQGIGISPDGSTLAIPRQAPQSDGRIVPTVDFYDAVSGAQVGAVSHDPVDLSRLRGAAAVSGAVVTGWFTPDGRYLITSGLAETRVWALGR